MILIREEDGRIKSAIMHFLDKKTFVHRCQRRPAFDNMLSNEASFQWCDCEWFMVHLEAIASLEIIPSFVTSMLQRSDQGFLQRIFAKIRTLLPIFDITQRSILSIINLFVLTLDISFIARTFSTSARSFQISYRSRNYYTNSVNHLFSGGTTGF